MNLGEILIVVLIAGVLLLGPLVVLVLSILAFRRSGRIHELARRVTLLEDQLQQRAGLPPASAPLTTAAAATAVPVPQAAPGPQVAAPAAPAQAEEAELIVDFMPSAAGSAPARASDSSSREPFGWETLIGQKAFGWMAVLLFVLSAAFFLRYAYQNHWIGPVGRVAIGELVGAGLLGLGWNYFRRGWARFSSMLTATGIVVLYLATYSAFGFYRLLPQQHAGAFLALLVIESMVLAVAYRSMVVALVAVIGGLLLMAGWLALGVTALLSRS